MHLINRRGFKSYQQKNKVDENYIFFLCSLWAPEDKCNEYRKFFISTTKKIKGLIFEGGFAPPCREDMLYMKPSIAKTEWCA